MEVSVKTTWGYINRDDYSQGWFIKISDLNSDKWTSEYLDIPQAPYVTIQGSDYETIVRFQDYIRYIEETCRREKENFESALIKIENVSIADFA